jgi:hypothetical protein
MIAKQNNKAVKKKYEKPVLRIVNIAPGMQTLGIGCKLQSTGMSYNQPCVSHACATIPGS